MRLFFWLNRFVISTSIIIMMKPVQVVKALGALAQPTRLAIFRLLVEAGQGGMAAGKISEKLSISPATLTFHFNTMSHAELIVRRQEGRFILYSANFKAMNGIVEYLTENCCGGNIEACKTPLQSNSKKPKKESHA